MRNIKLTIEYDGTGYRGWQIQPAQRTVQAVLKKAIESMTRHDVNLIGASRTDSGVHALAQVANFRTKSKIPCEGFLKGLNSLLPSDISVKKVEEAEDDFHSRRSAKFKHYNYLIYMGVSKPALLRDRVWHLRRRVGPTARFIKELRLAARPLVGRHDFSSFAAAGDCNRTKIREIKRIKIGLTKEGLISIDIFGTGFLKQMVRNIVGTLLNVPCPAAMRKILGSRDRKKAGVTAPASGLSLVEIRY